MPQETSFSVFIVLEIRRYHTDRLKSESFNLKVNNFGDANEVFKDIATEIHKIEDRELRKVSK